MGRAALLAGWRRAGSKYDGYTVPAMPASSPPAYIDLGPQVWLYINGLWTDVTSYVLYEEGIHIERGRQSESDSIDYSKCRLTFNNSDGRFSPRLPTSPYYGYLNRNTPIRVSRGAVDKSRTSYLYLPGTTGSYVFAPDSTAVSIAGDIEIVLDIALESWRDAQDLAGKYRVDGPDKSWALNIDDDGILQWVWSQTGSGTANAFSTIPVPAAPGERIAIKVTFDVDNGAGGNDTKFYISATGDGPWTQLGATVTNAGPTSIYNSDAKIIIGDILTTGHPPMAGKVYGFQLRNGIGGTLVANPDFTAQTEEDSSFTDFSVLPNITWTLVGASQFVDRTAGPFRFHGEVSEWPVVSDITGDFVTVTIEAAGIWRRLSQNETPAHSPMFRAHTNPSLVRVKAYWSCEDGDEATEIASNWAQGTGTPMVISGSPALASYSDWTASAALPVMSNASFTGRVINYTSSDQASVYMFLYVQSAVAAETSLMYITTTGTARSFDVRLLPNGNLRLQAWDNTSTAIDDGAGNLDAELIYGLNTRGFVIIGLNLMQSSADVKWYLTVNDFTNTDLASGSISALYVTDTIINETFGGIKSVTIGKDKGLDQIVLGHITVSDEFTTLMYDVGDAVNAYNGENPATRMLRRGGEDQVPIDIVASSTFPANSVTLGDQTTKTFTELLQEAEATDLGILHEGRDRFALRYRTRLSLANQAPAVTLSHSSHQIGEPLEPVDDDQHIVNDVFVIRDKGSKTNKTQTTGKLKTARPKSGGVGRYPDEKTISLTYDQQLADQVGFRLRLGTIDEARYPKIVINLHHPSISGNATLLADILAMDIGDRLVITDLPAHLPPDDISVIVHGYAERLDQFTHTMTLACVPEVPWEWAVVGELTPRADTSGSETSGAFISGTDTSLTAVTSSGALWTTNSASWPFLIRVSGVVLRVTAVSGTSSPQTLTVEQTPVNGVAKTIPDGSAINVANPAYVGMV